jgi:CBS domain containing-hemolysin-like protein
MFEIGLNLILVLVLVAANGFFVAAEFALVSVRKTRIDELISEGNRRARVVKRSLRDLDSYIAATQLGITMASLGLGWVGEPALAHLLDPILEEIVPPDLAYVSAHGIAFVIAFSIITVMHIVFGELAPKTIALQRSEATSLWVAAPLEIFLKVFRPIIFAMNGLGRLVVRGIGLHDAPGHALIHSEAELRMLVTASAQGGFLEETEQEIIDRAFVFHDDTAIDVMLPRTEIIGLPLNADTAQVQHTLQEHRLERYPVWEGDSDHITGVLHARDALAVLATGGQIDLPQLIRPVLQVPTSLPLDRLIEAMREARTHIALAVDEFGGTAGVVELERVIERLVGPLPDEFTRTPVAIDSETHEPGMDEQLDGLMLVQDVNETFDLALDESSAHTIGGLVFYELGRTPHIGDTVELDGARLTVTELDGLRISGVRLERTFTGRIDERVEFEDGE